MSTPPVPRFFSLIPATTRINFVGVRFRMLLVTGLLIVVGLASIAVRGGLNYGIDFAGGTMVHVKLAAPAGAGEVRGAVDRPELAGIVVQNVGGERGEYLVRALGTDDEIAGASATIRAGLTERFGADGYEVLRVETVGPKVGRDLWQSATLAVLAATIVMGLYIAIRFDLRFAVAAAAALVHDVLLTLGAISLGNVEFDLTTVAALLTVVGYSVNDTVIISDRIRENRLKTRRAPLADVMNLSINETLSRTLITSGTAILVTLVLFLLGGPVIHSFAFTLLVGFVVGTYSSVFVASPIVLAMERGPAPRRR